MDAGNHDDHVVVGFVVSPARTRRWSVGRRAEEPCAEGTSAQGGLLYVMVVGAGAYSARFYRTMVR